MRFSIKWMLVGTVYAALVAAAFATGQWPYASALWVATFFAVVYALALGALARGRSRAAAIGFAIGSVALELCLQFAPGGVPTARIVSAALPPQAQPLATAPVAPPTASWYLSPKQPANLASGAVPAVQPLPAFASSNYLSGTTTPIINVRDIEEMFAARVQTANALAAMVAGIVGSFLGVAAYRQGQRESE
jgi:hypothetical protein